MLFVIFIGLVCLAVSAYFVGDAVTLPARERHTSVSRAARYGSFRPALGAAHKPFRERVLAPLGERVARWTLKLHPRTTVDGVSARLLAAGLGRSLSPTAFLAFKSGLAIGGIVLGALFGGAVAGAGGVLFLSVTLAGLGFILPDLAVSSKARQRKERIRAELPDALDLMAVSVEAGMGFDGAISKLTDHMSGPLADEFALTLSEIRIAETEKGFGTGLRAQLERRRGEDGTPEAAGATNVELRFELTARPAGDGETLTVNGGPELSELRSELEAALRREETLRLRLEKQTQAHDGGLRQEKGVGRRGANPRRDGSEPG